MRGSRTTNKDKAKVIATKLESPDKTLREIEEETGVKPSTANDILKKDLPKVRNSSEIIGEIIDNDYRTISNMSQLAQKYTEGLLTTSELDRNELETANRISDSALKRKELLGMDDDTKKELVVKFEM